MKPLSTYCSVHILARQVISRTFSENMCLKVIDGRVWVTLSGILDDFWLEAGESLELEAGRFTVIEADRQSSTIELAPAGRPEYDELANDRNEKLEFERKLDLGCC